MDEVPQEDLALESQLRIKVIGLGGGGSNVLAGIDRTRYPQVEYSIVNTDSQALVQSPVDSKVLVGRSVTRGLGAGGDPEIGSQAIATDRAALEGLVAGADLLILVVGLGGGTGTVAAALLAELGTAAGAIVLTFATQPFTFEGSRRREVANAGLSELRGKVHGLVPVPNDLLLQETDESETALSAFAVADQWIGRGIHSICAMLFETGVINQDFGALRGLLQGLGGKTIFATGAATGGDYITNALRDLLDCPLLHTTERPKQLDRILVHLVAGPEMGLSKMQQLMTQIGSHFESNEEILFGAVIDPERTESLEVCLLAKVELESAARKASGGDTDRAREPMETEQGLGLEGFISTQKEKPPVHESKLSKKRKKAATDQDEFLFVDLEAQRGYFDQTDQNLYNNEDLDVPTYLRKGIKIKLK
ncbi:MAG: cell division protein FtsZ [Verrucomicrobia bacterium]|nr:cell division protein FtsZ [Verrucomicrobiota bacterium]